MSLVYRSIQRINPQKTDQPGKYYAHAVNKGDVTLRELAKEIAEISTVSIVDTIAVIESLIQLLPRHITRGETVRLGDFGSFSIGILSNGVDDETKVSADIIKGIKIYFRPAKELKKALVDIQYEKAS